MTFKDLLDKGEGTIYLVNIKKPYKVEVYDAIIMTRGTYFERYENYLNDMFYQGIRLPPLNPENIVIKRKSHNKRNNQVNGYPKLVDFNAICGWIIFPPSRLNDASFNCYNKVIAFVNKEDACDYVMDKIRRKKLDYNKMLVEANKLKFSL